MARWLPKKKKSVSDRRAKKKNKTGFSLKKEFKNNPQAYETVKSHYCLFENQIFGRTEQRLQNLVKKRHLYLKNDQQVFDFIKQLPSPEITGKVSLKRKKQKSTASFMTEQEIQEFINKPNEETSPKLKTQIFKEKLNSRAKHLNENMEKSLLWFKSLYDSKYKIESDMYNYPFGVYIPDLINKDFKYIIEIDGSIHDGREQQNKDYRKDQFFNKHGYEVFRIKYCDFGMFEHVITSILKMRTKI